LQGAQARFRERGIALAALSYDNVATLRDFAERYHIEYPLLADAGSEVIRRFHMLDRDNSENNIPDYGAKNVAYPGWFFVDAAGIVKERFIDPFWGERYTANNVIGRLFPELLENSAPALRAPHLDAVTSISDSSASPGSRVTLTVEIKLPERMHLYALDAKGYRPVTLVLNDNQNFETRPAVYPPAETLRLEAIQESAPVYQGTFRISQDIVVSFKRALALILPQDRSQSRSIDISGSLRYQACDDKTCYRAEELPLHWSLAVHRNDQQRPKPENRRGQ
jgi:hypothetical protein